MVRRILFPLAHGADVLSRMGRASVRTLGPYIELAVWNVYKGRMTGWLEDFRGVCSGMDLILVQEAALKPAHLEFYETARHEWIMARNFYTGLRRTATGVLTGCSVQASSASVFRSPDAEPLIGTPKLILATAYPLESGGNLLAVNVHAVNLVGLAKFKRQMAQVRAAIEAHDGPVILGGDFNTWSASRGAFVKDLSLGLGLRRAQVEARPKIRHLNQILDHVFYKGMELEYGRLLDDVGSSDHHPMLFRFRLNAEKNF